MAQFSRKIARPGLSGVSWDNPLKVQLVSRKPSFGPFSYEEQMNLDTKERFLIDESVSDWLNNHNHDYSKNIQKTL